MKSLELKIPPALVLAACALLAWALARAFPGLAIPLPYPLIPTLALAATGIALLVAGAAGFLRADTTVDPRDPRKSERLVTNGVYRLTRNPMYVGFAAVLLAYLARLSNASALLALPAYVLYIQRFQIRPEERILERKFGDAYRAYKARVRPWI